ncbi:MAG TPA: hypothetical protein VGM91_05240 [Conexibacter sp.]
MLVTTAIAAVLGALPGARRFQSWWLSRSFRAKFALHFGCMLVFVLLREWMIRHPLPDAVHHDAPADR